MIGLVRVALRRPYTMAIAALLIMLMGMLSVQRMLVDIFPTIDIPVVFVAWSYNGLSAEDMERRVVLISERSYSTTVNGIDRIEFAVDPRHRHPEDLLPARQRHRRRDRADFGAEQRHPAHRAAGHVAAEHHPVQCLERAGGAGHAREQDAARAAAVGLGQQLPAAAAVHDSRRVDARRLWRQEPADHRRGRPGEDRDQGPVADGRRQRARRDERHHSGRHRPHRAEGIQRSAQFEPAAGLAVQRSAGRHARRHSGSAERRRQGQRQLRAADQHRPHQRPARELRSGAEEFDRLDAGGGGRRPRHAARHSGDGAGRAAA